MMLMAEKAMMKAKMPIRKLSGNSVNAFPFSIFKLSGLKKGDPIPCRKLPAPNGLFISIYNN